MLTIQYKNRHNQDNRLKINDYRSMYFSIVCSGKVDHYETKLGKNFERQS